MEFIRIDNKTEDMNSIFINLGMAYLQELNDSPPNFNPEKYLRSMLKRQKEAERWLFLLKDGKIHIGFIHAKVDHDEHQGWGYILEIYIIPSECRKDWGRKLSDEIISLFRKKKIKNVWLHCSANAEKFWQSVGFVKTGKKIDNMNILTKTI